MLSVELCKSYFTFFYLFVNYVETLGFFISILGIYKPTKDRYLLRTAFDSKIYMLRVGLLSP